MSSRKKESALRQKIKDCVKCIISAGHPMHLSWIESHATSAGVPDVNYCCYGVEGWLELKAGPDIEVRSTQVRWFRDRIAAGGWPLFLIQWGECFIAVPGSRAAALWADPEHENILRLATTIWHGKIPYGELLKVMRNPRKEYEKSE